MRNIIKDFIYGYKNDPVVKKILKGYLFVALYLTIVFAGLICLAVSIEYIFNSSSVKSNSTGVCIFKIGDVEGCAGLDSLDSCKNFVSLGGAIFVKYMPKENPDQYNCLGNRATAAVIENYDKNRFLKYFDFPTRSVINYKDAGPQLFSNKSITMQYMPVLYFFIVSFLTLLYFRRKHDFISIPLIFLISLFVACLDLALQVTDSSFQLYIKINDWAYLLSDIIFLFWFAYAVAYLVCAFFYHSAKYYKGELTPLLTSLILFIDKARTNLKL